MPVAIIPYSALHPDSCWSIRAQELGERSAYPERAFLHSHMAPRGAQETAALST